MGIRIGDILPRALQLFQVWRDRRKLEAQTTQYLKSTDGLVSVKRLMDWREREMAQYLAAARKNDAAMQTWHKGRLDLCEQLLNGDSPGGN